LVHLIAIFHVELVSVAVPLHHFGTIVNFFREGAFGDFRRPRAQAHAGAHVLDASLFFQQRDHRFLCVLVELSAVGLFNAAGVSRELDRRHLHSQAKSEIWNLVLSRETCSLDFSFNAAKAKTAGNQNSGHIF